MSGHLIPPEFAGILLNEMRPGFRTVLTPYKVATIEPDLATRFYWRAVRRCNRLNDQRVGLVTALVFTYRWEVTWDGVAKRWKVEAYQNQAIGKDRLEKAAHALFMAENPGVAVGGWDRLSEWQRESWRKEILEPVK